MDKLINQSIEDRETYRILEQIYEYEYSIPNEELMWGSKCHRLLGDQKILYDRYVEKYGKPPLVFEDHPVYFTLINDNQRYLILEEEKVDQSKVELLRLKRDIHDKVGDIWGLLNLKKPYFI